jgi:hypothetical protein
MKIVFITGGLEPGRDGVGDYARRLAGELIRLGHPSIILALNDSSVGEAVFESQEIEGATVSTLRLSCKMPWQERATMAREWVDAFNPDWVSLQFVPFSFHPKGLPFGLPRHLTTIFGTRRLHLMFHELWVLWIFPLSLRKRILGQMQKFCLRVWLRKLKPKMVTTQLPLYQAELRKLGVAAQILPLHGNIPVHPGAEAEKWLTDRCAPVSNVKYVKAGFFGNLVSTLDLSLLVVRMAGLNVPGNELLLFSAGKIGAESNWLWNSLEQALKGNATFLKLGELNEREASFYFSALDYGLTSYPPGLMGKSGSVAAMREHGLPVISCGSLAGGSSTSRGTDDPQGFEAGQPWTVNQSGRLFLEQLQSGKS